MCTNDRLHHRKQVQNGATSTTSSQSSSNGSRHSNNNNNNTSFVRRQKAASSFSNKRSTSLSGWVPMALTLLFLLALLVWMAQPQSRAKTPSSSAASSHETSTHNALLRGLQTTTKTTTAADSTLVYDVAVLGAGPAGLSAALFAARAGLRVLVLGSAQGLLSETPRLDNFPSYHHHAKTGGGASQQQPQPHLRTSKKGKARKPVDPSSGMAWLQTTRIQVQEAGVHFGPPGLLADALQPHDDRLFRLPTTLSLTYQARSVVIATGATPRRLQLAQEDVLWGNYVHNCAICDGHLYSGAHVLVVGGGNAALDAALYLSRTARQVTLVHRRDTFTANTPLLQRARAMDHVDILTPYTVHEWRTQNDGPDNLKLMGARLQHAHNPSNTRDIVCDGAFVMIGAVPNTKWLRDNHTNTAVVRLESDGRVALDNDDNTFTTQTSRPGVFAAGEVTDARYRQAITAAAQGAQAALDAERWLQTNAAATVSHPPPNNKILMESDLDDEEEEEEESEETDNDSADVCDMTQADCIQSIVQKHAVVVFSKPWCPFCRKGLEALASAGLAHPHVIDLTQHSNARVIQTTLQRMTGRRTVPNVFVGGKSIGGGDETAALQAKGQLRPLLESVGAIGNNNSNNNKSSSDRNLDQESSIAKHATNEKDGKENQDENDNDCNVGETACFDKMIQQHKLVVFSSYTCAECQRLLEFLAVMELKELTNVVELGAHYNISPSIRNQLVAHAKHRGVPSLFIGGQSIEGGYDKVSTMYHSGELQRRLEAVGLSLPKLAWKQNKKT